MEFGKQIPSRMGVREGQRYLCKLFALLPMLSNRLHIGAVIVTAAAAAAAVVSGATFISLKSAGFVAIYLSGDYCDRHNISLSATFAIPVLV